MSDTVIISIVTGLVSIITLIITSWVKYAQEKLHKQINSRMDQLLNSVATASKAEGVKEEQDNPTKT